MGICTCFRIPANEVMLKHCSHRTAPDLLFSVHGALGVDGALGVTGVPGSPELKFRSHCRSSTRRYLMGWVVVSLDLTANPDSRWRKQR